MKRIVLLLLSACGLFVVMNGQPVLGFELSPEYMPPIGQPITFADNFSENIHFRDEVPPELADSLNLILEQRRQALNVKGLSAALRLPDGSIWAGASGISEENPTVELTTDHRLSMGSIGKTLVAATVLDLYEEGLFGLDDSLHHFGLIFNNVDSNITVRQLLRHQSGIYNFTNNPLFNPTLQSNPNFHYYPAQIISQFVGPPQFAAGTAFSYSNTNYLLLALIIEEVTDMPYFEVIRQRIIDPLGLEQTFMPVEEPWQSPIAHLWLDANGNGVVTDFHQNFTTWTALLTAVAPAGGYFTTPSDLVEWMYQMHAGDLLNADTKTEMYMTVNANLGPNSRYGLGIIRRSFLDMPCWGHGGDLSYASQVWYFPQKGVSIAVQDNDGSAVSWDHDPTIRELLQACIDYAEAHPTAVEELRESVDLQLFPNPANDQLNIYLSATGLENQTVLLSIINSLGTEVQRSSARPSSRPLSADISGLVPGVYYLRVESKLGSVVKPFVKR